MSLFSKPLVAGLIAVTLALAPALADARAGGGSTSMGSRGARTYSAPPPTATAPQAAPIQRSITPEARPASPSAPLAAPAPAAQPSFAQRNPFVTGLLGGLVGAGIGSMLFGHGGFGMSGLGMAGGLGLLLQLALIGLAIYLAVAFFRRRMAADGPAASGPAAYASSNYYNPEPAPMTQLGGGGAAPASASGGDAVGIVQADYESFEHLLGEIQTAWGKGDIAALRRQVTPEMLSYFSELLSANVSKGIENHVADVKLETGDLAEAWREGNVDYATVAMRWSALDYTVRSDTGAVVEGSKTARTEAVEIWTFMRSAGGRWLLAAIQQAS